MAPSSRMVKSAEDQQDGSRPGWGKLSVNHTRAPCSSSRRMAAREGRSFLATYSAEQEITACSGRSRRTSRGVRDLASPWWGTFRMAQGSAWSSQAAP